MVSEPMDLVAERACFDAFVTCYVQELGAGTWHTAGEWSREDPGFTPRGEHVIELVLPRQERRFAIDVTYRSAVGRHLLGAARSEQRGGWRDVERLPLVLALAHELFGEPSVGGTSARGHELELIARYAQSQQLMARYLRTRAEDPTLDSPRFIDAEQSMLYGHWRHPTPKSRQGMADWEHESFAPELRGTFQLHYFAVARHLVRQRSARAETAEALLGQMLSQDAPALRVLRATSRREEVLVPVHPLQADWLLHQPHVRRWLAEGLLRDVGRLGPRFTATSSVRTVYSEDQAYMLKLSIPVKITNSLRVNRQSELPAGVSMAELFERLGERVRFRCIADPAYLEVEAPDGGESGFELLLRENPFRRGEDDGICCVAALVQEALPHRASRLRTLLEGLALTEGRPVATVAFDWLYRYVRCVVEPLLRLYDDHGIALEAHQQNSLLDLRAGYPRAFYFRDSQGYYLSSQHRASLVALLPGLLQRPELFFDDGLIERRLLYYLFGNHLFAIVQRLGADGLLSEAVSLSIVKSHLADLSAELGERGRRLATRALEAPQLPYKANLLTRAHDLDELAVLEGQAIYVDVENPLAAAQTLTREREVA